MIFWEFWNFWKARLISAEFEWIQMELSSKWSKIYKQILIFMVCINMGRNPQILLQVQGMEATTTKIIN